MKKWVLIFLLLCSPAFAETIMDKPTITPVPADDYLYLIDNGTTDGKATISSVMTQSESTLEALIDLQDLQGAVTDAQVPDDITVDSATSLSANGSNCPAGEVAAGVDETGDAEGCVDVWTEAENDAAGYAVSGGAEHDGFSDYEANEHIDWTADQGATNIHSGNYTDTTCDSGSCSVANTGTLDGYEAAELLDNTDDQTIDVFSFDGTSISLSLESDGEATKTLDISSVDTDTTYSAGGTLLDLTSETFSINEGTLTDTKYCTYEAGVGIECNSEGGSGYTNLTSFDDQTAWRVFYSDGSGDVTELSLGSSGTYLQSNGASSAPTWATPTGSGDVSKVGTPADNQIGVWTGDGTIEGTSGFTYDGATMTMSGGTGPMQLNIVADTDNLDEADTVGINLSQDGDIVNGDWGFDDNNAMFFRHNWDNGNINFITGGTGVIQANGNEVATSGGAFHDGFSDFVANEHIDWTADQGATNIHSGNIPDLSATYEVQLDNEAGLYAVLSDVSDFVQGGEANSIDSDMYVDDSIDDAHINWGTGAGQVSSDDVTEGSTNKYEGTTAGDYLTLTGEEIDLDAEVYTKTIGFSLESPTDDDAFLIWKAPYDLTITDTDCITGADNSAVIDIQECDSAGANCATVDATITCDADGASDDGSLSNGTIDSGDWVKLDVGTVTGEVGYVTGTIKFTPTD